MNHIKLFEQFQLVIGYHGTSEPFTEFERRDGSVSTIFGANKVKRTGFFFADNPSFAAQYGPHIMRCALHVNNWLDLRNGFPDDVIEALESMGVSAKYLYNLPYEETWEIFDGEDASFLLDKIVALGFDGVSFTEYDGNGLPSVVYVVLDKSKIEILDNGI